MENRVGLDIPITSVSFVSKSEYVYRALREAILKGSLEPGLVLNQAELAERFSVSRMPIRDAIKMLAREGLVRIVLHKGATVAHFSIQDIREIYAIRKILEGYAVREAIPHVDGATLSRLEKINRAIARFNRKGDVDAMIKENEQFHLLLYAQCRNRKLIELIQRLWSSYPKRIFWDVPGRADQVVLEHNEIVTAVKDRNADRAQRLVQNHLFLAQEGLERMASIRDGKARESL
ncbi:MAG: GntR family transcriptional regulator [Deltaproteobacteria bacterium]|nr:GntR family transcriptional regulator [Deltaproteobacteria bacterium]